MNATGGFACAEIGAILFPMNWRLRKDAAFASLAFSEKALRTAAKPRAGSAIVRTSLPAGACNMPSNWARTTGSGGISANALTCAAFSV